MLLIRALVGALLLVGVAGQAVAAWHEARSKNFIIYSEQKAEQLRAYAERLERFDAAVRRISGFEERPLSDAGKVTIYVLPSIAAVQKLHGGGGGDVLGFYSPRASGSVAFVSHRTDKKMVGLTADHVFQHEYIHHLMLSAQKTPYPAWMIEGYAEFYGTAEVQKDGSVHVGLPPQARGSTVLMDLGFNAEQMLSGVLPKNHEQMSSLYAKGWLLTHYLAFDAPRRPQLDRYLTLLWKGEAPLAAAKAAFGDLKQLDRELDRYGRGTFRGAIVPPGPTPEVQIRRLSEAEDAIMPVRVRSDRGVNKITAPQVAADARRIAARYPNDPFVQGVVAEAEYDAQEYTSAIAAADRALAARPNDLQALIYRGRAMLALANKDPAKADWADVRRYLVRANRADLESAEPLWLFYQTFEASGQAPSKVAVEGLLYAHALAPHDRGLRFAAARRLLEENRAAEAEPMFAALAFDPHLPIARQGPMVSALERIKARDPKGALKILAEQDEEDEAEGTD